MDNTRSEAPTLSSGTSDTVRRTNDHAKDNLLQRIAKSKWSPMTAVSDEEYRRILLRQKEEIEDGIKAVDKSIEELKAEERKQTSRSPK